QDVRIRHPAPLRWNSEGLASMVSDQRRAKSTCSKYDLRLRWSRSLQDTARNEQQKALLLTEVARLNCENAVEDCQLSTDLKRESEAVRERARAARANGRKNQ